MRKCTKMLHSVAHAIHKFLAAYHIAMMEEIVGEAETSGWTDKLNKKMAKHDEKNRSTFKTDEFLCAKPLIIQ